MTPHILEMINFMIDAINYINILFIIWTSFNHFSSSTRAGYVVI